MAYDFEAFLDVFHSLGVEAARESVETWKRERLIDVTQHGLMISHLSRKSGDVRESILAIQRALSEGGEVSPLNISLAEDFILQQKYAEAIECCNEVIRDRNDMIASRFLSTALLLKSYALLKTGKYDTAETILRLLRPDLTIRIEGKFQTPETLLAELRER